MHERTVDSDFLIIILRDLALQRKDLTLVLMSATLNADVSQARGFASVTFVVLLVLFVCVCMCALSFSVSIRRSNRSTNQNVRPMIYGSLLRRKRRNAFSSVVIPLGSPENFSLPCGGSALRSTRGRPRTWVLVALRPVANISLWLCAKRFHYVPTKTAG